MRLFFSIDPPQNFKNQLLEIQNSFRERVAAAFVDPKIFHVTILFLGEVSDSKLKEIIQASQKVALGGTPFVLASRALEFSNNSLVLAFEEDVTFSNLARSLSQSLKGIVHPSQMDAHPPHLTLLRFAGRHDNNRIRDPGVIRQLADGGRVFKVSSFYLINSQLTPTGPKYKNLAEFPLGKIYNAT